MSAAPLRNALEHLDGVKQTGPSQWQARCPVHEADGNGHTPSLSIGSGDGGRVLLHCHAGCTPQAVCSALGLRLSDLMPPKMGRPARPGPQAAKAARVYALPCLAAKALAKSIGGELAGWWPYVGADGGERLTVLRFNLPRPADAGEGDKPPKTFRPLRRDGGGWAVGDPAGPLPLYRLADLDGRERVYIVEGELCADAAASLCLTATTSAHGAKSPSKTDWRPLAGRDVVILPDNDKSGEDYTHDVATILAALTPPATVRIVRLPDLPPKGDIVDWLAADGPMDAHTNDEIKAAIEALADAAPTWTPTAETLPAIKCASDDALAEGDVRLGREFAAAFAERVRYCPDLESWLVWDGRRWAPDAVHEAERLMQNLARDRLAAAANLGDTKTREAENRVWVQAMRRNRIEAALWAARSDPRLIVRLADLDSDPWTLNVGNGTLNLKTGRLRHHDPADLITKLAPVEYRPDADLSEWLRFLSRVLPDPALGVYLQRATGYSLTGLATEEILFFICGPTAGGKSTFISAVGGALGDYAASANFATFLAQRNKSGPRPDIVRLAGKRFVSSVETEEGAQLAGGLLKWIIGQDQLCERTLYKTEVEFLPTFSLWLVSNFRPRAQDDDSALWRRLMLLSFEMSIPENERDPTVKARLRDPTIGGPAVLAWAVAGCLDWQEHGLQPPPAVLAATRQWRAENDPIIDWLSERATLNPLASTAFKDLNHDYRTWAEDGGLKPISGKKLAERLQAVGCQAGSGAGHVRIYTGIGLKC